MYTTSILSVETKNIAKAKITRNQLSSASCVSYCMKATILKPGLFKIILLSTLKTTFYVKFLRRRDLKTFVHNFNILILDYQVFRCIAT